MPELPEVETTVRGLRPVLEGQRIARVQARREDLRRAFPPDLGQRLTGATVTGLGRRAKYGLIHTDRAETMVFHLGMSGRWRVDPSEVLAHDHLVLETGAGRTLYRLFFSARSAPFTLDAGPTSFNLSVGVAGCFDGVNVCGALGSADGMGPASGGRSSASTGAPTFNMRGRCHSTFEP